MNDVGYRVSSRDYLLRARRLRLAGNQAELFYAAFELRAGLEMRLSEYLGPWDHVSTKAKRNWRIGHLDREAVRAFGAQARVMEITQTCGGTQTMFVYTPVRQAGRRVAERLGEYLHAPTKPTSFGAEWWSEFEATIDLAISELSFAVTGTLLGPVLWKSNRREAQLMTELLDNVPPPHSPREGDQAQVVVRYHAAEDYELPKEAYAWRV